MSKHKFSLGPWKPSYGMFVHAANNEWVALVKGDGDENKEANARLIAAAPDMLLCLRNVIDSHGEVDQDLWNRIREVIANATGEAS